MQTKIHQYVFRIPTSPASWANMDLKESSISSSVISSWRIRIGNLFIYEQDSGYSVVII